MSTETMPESDFNAANRKKQATEFGLPETSTWDEIGAYRDEIARKKQAAELGLLETATWNEIGAARGAARDE